MNRITDDRREMRSASDVFPEPVTP
jgi:hypothetical protein